MMDVSTVDPDILTERLDAEFYRPSFLENHRLLSGLGKRSTLGEASTAIKLGYTGPIDDCYSSEGALFLTSKNIVDGRVVVGPDTLRIRLDVHNGKLSSTIAKVGDLLFSRTGTVGKAAVLHDGQEHYNFAAHLFAVRLKPAFDSGYLGAFFNSRYGSLQSERMQRGTIIQGLSIYDIPGMVIPNHSESVQRYIGDKVRHAEQLRLHADACTRTFEKLIDDCCPELSRLHAGSAKHSRAPASLLDGSLNPGEFNPDRLLVRSYLQSNGGRTVGEVADVETPVTNQYGQNDIYIGLDSIGSSSGSIVPSTIAKEAVVGAVRQLPVGPVISKLRPYLNKVAYIPSWLSGALNLTALWGYGRFC